MYVQISELESLESLYFDTHTILFLDLFGVLCDYCIAWSGADLNIALILISIGLHIVESKTISY